MPFFCSTQSTNAFYDLRSKGQRGRHQLETVNSLSVNDNGKESCKTRQNYCDMLEEVSVANYIQK